MISPLISPKPLSLVDRLKRLDVHPKTKEDYRVRTVSGGIASIVALLAMAYLFFSELSYSMTTEIVDHMFVNSTRDVRLPFHFNITFPRVSCSLLSADAMDPLGNKQDGVESHVYKTRLDKFGRPISDKTKHDLGNTFTSEESIQKHVETSTGGDAKEGSEEAGSKGWEGGEAAAAGDNKAAATKCGTCYGAGDEGQCCNTCAEVKAAYKKKGWAFMGLNVEQCKGEQGSPRGMLADNGEEGCNMHGTLILTQEAGNVHLAPGEQLRHSGSLNVADLVMFTFLQFNISHEIHYLALGDEFPGFKSPLSNQKRNVEDGYGMYQYYLKVVPTIYRYLDGRVVESNQYAVTEHVRHINPGSNRGLPGVWLFYDTSPVHVEFRETRRGLLPFFTSVCAIVGGTFSVMSVVDKLIHNFLRTSVCGKRPVGGS